MKKPAINKVKAKQDILAAQTTTTKTKKNVKDKRALAERSSTAVVVVNPKADVGVHPINISPALAIGIFLLTMLYALMLISHTPADPAFSHASPNTVAENWIGMFGAWTSDIALYVFGWNAYWFIPVGMMIAWRLVSPHYVKTAFSRLYHLMGLAFLLVGFCAVEALRLYPWASFLPGDAGGVLGQCVMTSAVPYLGAIGVTLVMLVMGLAGLSIFFGFSWLSVFEAIGMRIERLYRHDPQLEQVIKKEKEEKATKKESIKDTIANAIFKKTPDEKQADVVTQAPALGIDIKPQAKVEPSAELFKSQQTNLFGDSDVESAVRPIRPDLSLFDPAPPAAPSIDQASLGVMSSMIESKLACYNVQVQVKAANPGPVVTRYEIALADGVKSASVKSLENDLARVLSVQSVRVLETVAGTSYMGIEVPNPKRQIVKLVELLGSQVFASFKGALPLCLGKSITGEPFVMDLAKMPHLLVAGTTGSGKSVGVNSMILSLLYRFEPKKLRLILVDPKKVEFSWYEDIPHLLCPVVDQMTQAKHALQWCVKEMDRRYHLAHLLRVRNLETYNQKVRELRASGTTRLSHYLQDVKDDFELEELPYIVVVVDEMADLLMVDRKGVEDSLIRLAQKARASGIHLILATQRPSADVLSGLLRTNIPSRAAFQVATGSDSRIILDQMGAENLLGYGDFLCKMPNVFQGTERVQGAFVTDGELERITQALRAMAKPKYIEDVLVGEEEEGAEGVGERKGITGARDALFDKAVQIILDSNKCSTTFLQRRLGVGYPRAANIVDELEAEGIVSAADGNGRRTILARADSLEL